MDNQTNQTNAGERTLVFRVGQEQFGLPLASVMEVFESNSPPTPIPGAPDWVAGVINHHGQVVPVLRMSVFLTAGYDRENQSPGEVRPHRIILLDLSEGRFGLAVDHIESIEDLRTDGADFGGKKRSWHRGALLEMVDPVRMMDDINSRLGQMLNKD